MTIKEALKKYSAIEIDLLLAHLLSKSKEFIYLDGRNELTRVEVRKLMQMIKRRLTGEPIAYILGYKDFYDLRFKVNHNALIPRPETEGMVSQVIQTCKDLKQKSPLKIIDVGTGSGCIVISLEKGLRAKGLGFRGEFYGSDVSKAALLVARQNAQTNKAKIKFIHSDLLKNIKFSPDIIVANLPYGWSEWKNNTTTETVGLKFEPGVALFTKERGLYQIKKLLDQIAALTTKPKVVYLEFDPRQKTELEKLIKECLPKADKKFYRDYNNFWRFVEIKI